MNRWVMSSETPQYQLKGHVVYNAVNSTTATLIRNHTW